MAATFQPAAPALPRYSVAVPRRWTAPTRATYLRRRLVAATFLATLVASTAVAVQHGLADRGSEPASAASVGHPTFGATGVVVAGALGTYVVQPGDTLWSIARRVHPTGNVGEYVDALVALHGGARLEVGDRIQLP
jgi:nucleoid-associated protein YgaU